MARDDRCHYESHEWFPQSTARGISICVVARLNWREKLVKEEKMQEEEEREQRRREEQQEEQQEKEEEGEEAVCTLISR